MSNFSSSSVDPKSGYIKVLPTLQIADAPSNMFAVGDVADTGATKAARPGFTQSRVIVNNIQRLIADSSEALETYRPDAGGIHLTLGIVGHNPSWGQEFVTDRRFVQQEQNVKFRNPPPGQEPVVMMEQDGTLDMNIDAVWTRRGIPTEGRDYRL